MITGKPSPGKGTLFIPQIFVKASTLCSFLAILSKTCPRSFTKRWDINPPDEFKRIDLVIKERKSWSNNFQEFICNDWSDEKWKELKKIAIWNEFVLELDHHDPHCDRLFNNLHSLFSRTKGSILNPRKVGKKDQERIEKWWRKESRTRNDRRPLKILLVLLVKHLSVAQTQSNVITSTRISLLKQIFSVYSFSFSKWETGRGVSSKLFYSHRMEQASSTFLQYFITSRFEICRSLPVFLLLNHTVSDMVFFFPFRGERLLSSCNNDIVFKITNTNSIFFTLPFKKRDI